MELDVPEIGTANLLPATSLSAKFASVGHGFVPGS